ncbi:unnamed protein product [Schistosoma turkestanicum]|nr:unnamed protein product [Schistosoma turkestanicum]
MMEWTRSEFNKFIMKSENKVDVSDEAKAFIKNVEKYDFIRLSLPDINGIHLSKLLPRRFAKKLAMDEVEIYSGTIAFGPRFEIISIPEIVEKKHINSILKPDFSTLHPCHWISQKNYPHPQKDTEMFSRAKREGSKYSFCSILCDMYWPNNQPMCANPRFVAQKLIRELEDKYNLRLYSAFEPEFRAFVKGSYETSCLKPKPGDITQLVDLKKPIPWTNFSDMYRTSLLSVYENYFADIDYNMQLAGIYVQDYSNEDGEGQLECPLIPTWGLTAADNYFILKQAVKEIGAKHGMEISFMTTPLLDSSSSGCHYNHSLWYADSNRNAFYDDKVPDKLSTVARHWIGGILEHLPAMLAVSCPTVNCYRRLHKRLAPSCVSWDFHDRYISVRVKNFNEKRTYIENRIPSSASCPYHVLAATVAAGLDGLERQIQPPPSGLKLENGQTNDCKILPSTIQQALQCLMDDKILVNKLGVEFVDWYIQVKKDGDLSTLGHLNIHDNNEKTLAYERYEYFNFM